jgi:hypothetical protein
MLGNIVATPGALKQLVKAQVTLGSLLRRHLDLEQGELSNSDQAANKAAIEDGSRIFSAFLLPTGVKLWIITEAIGEDGRRN